jgi:arginine N-succinyltransferase
MFIIRPIRLTDLDAFEHCAMTAAIGITNLPKNRQLLEKKIQTSLDSFSQNIASSDPKSYTFILEDISNGDLGGTSSIFSSTGVQQPLYFYRIETVNSMKILQVVSYSHAPSEICGLYLLPNFRKEGLGRLLSLSRFLFIASFPNLFEEVLFAEMRGNIDENNISPFWEALGRHFLNIGFPELLALEEKSKDFIPNILPKWPIYIALLPKEAQEVIGQTHLKTAPALKMLSEEGFKFTEEIDLFDAGPKIEAKAKEVRTIKESRVALVHDVIPTLEKSDDPWLLSNTSLNFRACYGTIKKLDEDRIVLSAEVAKALYLERGSEVRYVSLARKT